MKHHGFAKLNKRSCRSANRSTGAGVKPPVLATPIPETARSRDRSKVIHTQLVPQRGERAKKLPSRARPSPLAFRVRHKCGSPNICETDTATCVSEAGGFTVERAVARVRTGNLGLEGPIIPFYFGFPYPTRMVVVRLSDGDLFVWSPIPLSPPMRREVDKLGPVRHLVAPNLLHHLFLAEWKSAYPEARLYAAPGLRRRRGDLTFDCDLADTPNPRWWRTSIRSSCAAVSR